VVGTLVTAILVLVMKRPIAEATSEAEIV